jgi:hypothetical protein
MKYILLLLVLNNFAYSSDLRVFTSKDNSRKVTATLIDFNPNSNNVTLKRFDGKLFTTHALKFSLQDRIFIAKSYNNQMQAILINRVKAFTAKRNVLNNNGCILSQPHLGNIMANNLCNPKLMNYHDYGTIVKKMNEKFIARQIKPIIIQPRERARVINQPRPTTIMFSKPEIKNNKNCVTCPILKR